MITKIETIRGTMTELKEYCNSLLKPASVKDADMKVGDKFYTVDSSFEKMIKVPGFNMLPYVECIKYETSETGTPEVEIALKLLWLFVA